MAPLIPGIHHVTALAGDPATNLDFYTRVLALRLVKRTVNFDDPTTWHLYFGDRLGSPGTAMTFFPHPLARTRRPGRGEVARTAFAIPTGTLDFWQQRLTAEKLTIQGAGIGDRHELTFHDPHGTQLALIETESSPGVAPWAHGGVPAEAAIHGFESVRLNVKDLEPTAALFRELFGWREVDRSDDRCEFVAGSEASAAPGQRVEIVRSSEPTSRFGAGSVHHVAFRTPDDETQLAMQRRLREAGFNVTDVQERQYFRSIYFREPGGVIFEIATDGPGFAIDESEAELGQQLKLPPWLEPRRSELERTLPPLSQEALP